MRQAQGAAWRVLSRLDPRFRQAQTIPSPTAGLVDRASEPVLHPGVPDGDLVEVPLVFGVGQPAADPVGEGLAELERPLPHGLVADHDAPCRQHLLDHAQAEREAEIEPDRVADHLGREAVPGIGRLGGRRTHARRLSDRGQTANPAPS